MMKVKCEICGKEFHQITTSHLQTHNISFNKYKSLYPNSKLTSNELHQKRIEINSGENNPFFGKNHSLESRKLIKDNHSQIKGEYHPLFNKFVSKETRQKMSDNHADVSGNKNWNYGKHKTEGQKKNHSEFMTGRYIGELNGNWKGGIDRKRSYVLPEAQCRKINQRFDGSEFHHLSKSIGIYIPKELHRHFYHNLRTGINMDEMSILSFQFIKGWI